MLKSPNVATPDTAVAVRVPDRVASPAPLASVPMATKTSPVKSVAVLPKSAEDDFGNTATDFTGDVFVAIGTDASGAGDATLSGTRTATAVSGVATFGDLSIDRTGNGYTLLASAPSAPEL